jgi:hypothetical protein
LASSLLRPQLEYSVRVPQYPQRSPAPAAGLRDRIAHLRFHLVNASRNQHIPFLDAAHHGAFHFSQTFRKAGCGKPIVPVDHVDRIACKQVEHHVLAMKMEHVNFTF